MYNRILVVNIKSEKEGVWMRVGINTRSTLKKNKMEKVPRRGNLGYCQGPQLLKVGKLWKVMLNTYIREEKRKMEEEEKEGMRRNIYESWQGKDNRE